MLMLWGIEFKERSQPSESSTCKALYCLFTGEAGVHRVCVRVNSPGLQISLNGLKACRPTGSIAMGK